MMHRSKKCSGSQTITNVLQKDRRTRKAPDIFKLTGRVTARTGGFTFGLSGAGSSEAKTAKVALARKLAVILHRCDLTVPISSGKPLTIDEPPAKLTGKSAAD